MSSRQKIFTNSVPEALEEGLLKKQVLGGQEFFECVVCDMSMSGVVPAKSHLEGTKHLKALQRESYAFGLASSFNKLDLTSSNLSFISTSEHQTDAASNPEDCNELLVAMKRGIVSESLVCNKQFLKCNVCNISCTGIACMKEHLQGEQHNKRVKRGECIEEERDNFQSTSSVRDEDLVEERMVHGSLQYVCKLCDIPCTGKENLTQHLLGKQHQKTKKRKMSMGWPILGPSPSSKESYHPLKESTSQHVNSSAPVEQTLPRKDTKPDTAFSELILETASGHYCLVCNTLCSNEAVLQKHLEGPHHYQKLQEQISLQEEIITPAPSSSSSSGLRRSTSPVRSTFNVQPPVAYNIGPAISSDLRDIKIYLANEPLDDLFSE